MNTQTIPAAGFDYGTSNCALGVCRANAEVQLLALEAQDPLIPSTLYAPKPDLDLGEDEGLLDVTTSNFQALRFGRAALAEYLKDPAEGYFVKSPKSFLGARGLSERVKDRFVTVVAAMMGNIKQQAERTLDSELQHVVIGRPVNFQGAGGEAENQQAVSMLLAAAREVGFEEVRFLYEPLAAALEYEARLTQELKLLVVDVGGGTTDCSFVRVGPSRREQRDRTDDILGHTGERLGGNDYDQQLALKTIMPALGFGDALQSGLPLPNVYYVDAVSTNDVNAQQRFYSQKFAERLDELVRDAVQPDKVALFRELHHRRSTYRLLSLAEQAKIELSSHQQTDVALAFLGSDQHVACTAPAFATAAERLLQHLTGLVREVIGLAQTQPDVIYLTGGMARSPLVRQALQAELGDVPIEDSQHFVSVVSGLTLWATRQFAN